MRIMTEHSKIDKLDDVEFKISARVSKKIYIEKITKCLEAQKDQISQCIKTLLC